MPEGLSASEVGKEIAEHHEHTDHDHDHGASEPSRHDRLVTIAEAVLLSVVALLAAWSGYSAAKWGTESSLSLAKASSARSKASLAEIQATQIRTLDSVSFNAAETAYLSHDAKLFALSLRRMRPGYLPAVRAWLALHPLTNPKAPPDPSYMPQYVIPQDAQARTYNAQANAAFTDGEVSRREPRTSTSASPCFSPRSSFWSGSGAAFRSPRRGTAWRAWPASCSSSRLCSSSRCPARREPPGRQKPVQI